MPVAANDNPFALDTPAPAFAPGGSGATSSVIAPRTSSAMPMPVRLLILLLPVALLCTCLLGILARDIFFAPSYKKSDNLGGKTTSEEEVVDDGPVDKTPRLKLIFDEGKAARDFDDTMMFGVHKYINPGNPNTLKLNYYDNGKGNSVVAKINGNPYGFGKNEFGKWDADAKDAGKYGGRTRTFGFGGPAFGVKLTQTVMIVPSDSDGRDLTRQLNVVLAKYTFHNTTKKTQKVGLRVLLDTYIGDNDGVPFTIPGEKGLVATKAELTGPKVPDFIQVLQRADLNDPGLIVQLTMNLNKAWEKPSKLVLTRWPVKVTNEIKSLDRWDVPFKDIGDDSSVAMFWDDRDLAPGASVTFAFAYGSGSVSIDTVNKGKLGMTVDGARYIHGKMTVVAYVNDPKASNVTLKLPEGLSTTDPLTQPVPPGGGKGPVPVTWHVTAGASPGQFEISVATNTGLNQKRRVTITTKSLFN
jgi:hypothetical protein